MLINIIITFCVGEDGAEFAGLDRGLADETLVGFWCWAASSGRPRAGYRPTPLAANDSSIRPEIRKQFVKTKILL